MNESRLIIRRTAEKIGRFYLYEASRAGARIWQWHRCGDVPIQDGPCWWLHRIGDEDGEFVYTDPVKMIMTSR